MQLKQISVKNFRLLHHVDLSLEKETTVIVGRNNSGKTSLTEVVKRLLKESNPTFRLEDFSFCGHQNFWDACIALRNDVEETEVRKIIPSIEIQLKFSYSMDEDLGILSDFIVDVNQNCTEALAVARYSLKEGGVMALFEGLAPPEQTKKDEFFRVLGERIPVMFGTSFLAVDPNDSTNHKPIEGHSVRALCMTGFISAQRGLDDVSHKDQVVIGKVLENLFNTAKSNPADLGGHATAKELESAVRNIQDKIGEDFNRKLDSLLPALSTFGYPKLPNSNLRTETTLDVSRLLTNNTKIRYTGVNGVHLPEAYNGLGTRNIILILLQLREFYKLYEGAETKPNIHLVFVEEPEVHLHPQMQEVFIRKLSEIAKLFSEEQSVDWPVQFIVSTHSAHIANEAHFETIRYFFAGDQNSDGILQTIIKDLREGLSGKGEPDRSFLHQYMTLTRCDLFFADKAILIEGTTERLLLPKIIRKVDEVQPLEKKLSSQYLSIIEVGGAYAHIFFDLLEFLEIKTLIITDIDSVKKNGDGHKKACQVQLGQCTSNACIKAWFSNNDISPSELIAMGGASKINGLRRIAFQQPELDGGGPCGRSFEDAFMLANLDLFPDLEAVPNEEVEAQAWVEARDIKKSEFALSFALTEQTWVVPRYIREGLLWLGDNDGQTTESAAPLAEVAA